MTIRIIFIIYSPRKKAPHLLGLPARSGKTGYKKSAEFSSRPAPVHHRMICRIIMILQNGVNKNLTTLFFFAYSAGMLSAPGTNRGRESLAHQQQSAAEEFSSEGIIEQL